MRLPETPRVIRYDETDSTSERAFAAIAEGSAQHGDIHLAEFQTQGRGRLGRAWQARPGEGLLFSLVLFPPAPAPKPPQLTVATCLALHDVVRQLGIEQARLKWPNDLLVGKSKLCGILLETRGFEDSRPHYVVGVGLNVSQTEFPAEITDDRPVTSLALEGIRTTREELLELIWQQLAVRLAQASGPLFADYTDALGLTDEVVLGDARGQVRGALLEIGLARGVRLRNLQGEIVETPLEFVRELRSSTSEPGP